MKKNVRTGVSLRARRTVCKPRGRHEGRYRGCRILEESPFLNVELLMNTVIPYVQGVQTRYVFFEIDTVHNGKDRNF